MIFKAIAAVVIVLVIAVPALARECETERLSSRQLHETGAVERDADNLCQNGVQEHYWTVGDWFTGNESYLLFCDPVECEECEEGWKPKSVTLALYWNAENTCSLRAKASIQLAVPGEGECQAPGVTVCVSDPITIGPFSPAGLWAISIPLPDACTTLEDPFFTTIEFLDTCEELPVLVTDRGPCDECNSWNDWGLGWRKLCDYGFPGNLSVYTTIECQGSTAVEQASWSTIKGMYR